MNAPKMFQGNRWALAASLAGFVLFVAAVAVFEGRRGAGRPLALQPEGFVVTPTGGEVSRLAPVRVTFPAPPAAGDPARLLHLEPAVRGRYTWIGDRTVQYQPEFPGLLRGQQYTVNIAPDSDGGLPTGHTYQFTTEGVLKVEHVIPQPGDMEVPTKSQVLVEFSRSVAPLTMLREQSPSTPLEFDPPLQGKGEWLNSSLYRFVPEDLQPSTQYRVRIPAGLTSVPDGVLREDFAWIFSTVTPGIVSVSPRDQQVGPDAPVVVRFNQAMDRAHVEERFLLCESPAPGRASVSACAARSVPGSFSWSEGDTVVTFSPSPALPFDSRYEVVLPAGLKSARGGAMRGEWRSSFFTVGQPRITGTSPSNGSTQAERFGITINFSNPMDEDSFEDRVAISGIDQEKPRFSWRGDRRSGGGTSLHVSITLKPSAPYSVSIADGAKDRFGQPLGAYSFSFTTRPIPSSLNLAVPGREGTYSASGEQALYYRAVNIQAAAFSLYEVGSEGRTLLRRWTEHPAGEPNQVIVASTSLGGGEPLPAGDYFVSIGGQGYASELRFTVVNTALITKLSQDELLVWALDHDSGQPLQGLPVQARRVRQSRPGVGSETEERETRTDARGLASFPHTTEAGGAPYWSAGEWSVKVDHEGRRGLASLNWRYGANFWELGVPLDYSRRQYVGHLYTDRPIYRPGEEVHYKGVLRLDDDAVYQVPPGSTDLRVVANDSTRKELGRQELELNEFGTFAGTFTLSAEAPTGEYSIGAEVATPDGRSYYNVAGITFMVAEFRKPEFQVAVAPEHTAYIDGDTIQAEAVATFFFGDPVAEAPVKWSAKARPYFPRPKGFERYTFVDQDYYRPAEVREAARAEGTARTNARGVGAFSLAAAITGNEGPQTYELIATVTDQNAQEVSAGGMVTVHPAEFYAGSRPGSYTPAAGQEVALSVVTVDTLGNPAAGKAVTVRVYEREWITVKEQAADGSGGRRYRSEPRDTLVDTLSATTDARATTTINYRPKNAGSLRLVAEVTDGRGRTARSSTFLWVSGSGYARWQVGNNDVLKLIADKDEYQVGDVAEVLVPSPYAGMTALVTVERGKVINRSVQSFPTNSERVRIPIRDDYVPNVFVSVALYRGPTAEDPVPRYKVGYVKLPVSTAARALNVTVQPDKDRTRPGEKVRYAVRVTDAEGKGVRAEVSIAVVDKAVLSLAEERSLTGLRAFWFERGLAVATASSLAVSIDRANDLIVDAPIGGKGGGGLGDERIRQDFRNTAFWEAQLKTDGEGRASVELEMPDNLTTWRANVRAVSGDTQVGEGSSEIISTQPMLVRPALPRFLRVGDRVTLRALVQNGTSSNADVQVSLASEGIELLSGRDRRANVPPGQASVLEWPARAPEDGLAKLTFSAMGPGGLRDTVVQELPVHLNVTPETTASGGVVRGEPRVEAIYLPHYAVVQGGKLQLSVQGSLSGSLSAELKRFEPRTWDGPRDVAARIIAVAGVRRAERRNREGLTSDEALERDVRRLLGMQRPDGGFAWCQRCPSDPNQTGWALIALGEARREGPSIPDGAVTRARTYLRGLSTGAAQATARPVLEQQGALEQRAFLLYALAAAGGPTRAELTALYQADRERLQAPGRAYLALALASLGGDLAEELEEALVDLSARAIPTANGNHWQEQRPDGPPRESARATALSLLALLRAAPDHPLMEETVRWLVIARGVEQWVPEMDRALGILALSEYMARTGELAGEYSYQAQLNGKEVMSGRFEGTQAALPHLKDVPLSQLPLGQQSVLSFLRDFSLPGRLYYTLNLRYLTPARDTEALNRGIAVSHAYSTLDDPDRPVSKVKLGETVRIKVAVMVPNDLAYVVVDDLLPAGLEPIDPKLKITPAGVEAALEQQRRQAEQFQPRGGCGADWYPWYSSPWRQVDIRDDRVSLRGDQVGRGMHEYVYYARATTPGEFFLPPAHGYQSVFPDVFGRSDSGRFTVEP